MTEIVDITRRVEFDAGHRIPDHRSKCRNVHGHRFILEATIRGTINPIRRESDDGMVSDFGDLKSLMLDTVAERWDHGFLLWEGDTLMQGALAVLGPNHKTIVLPFVPTVENLASHAFELLDQSIKQQPNNGYSLQKVVLFETPNCRAEKVRE